MNSLPLRTHLGPIARLIQQRLALKHSDANADDLGPLELTLEKYSMHGVTLSFRDPRDGVQYELLLRPTPLDDYIPTEPSRIPSSQHCQLI